ncbi:hypothetical protein B0H10DRAFT_2324716 [Mycena sp. CBHHK59/15]|nr:hypothetical protein B0H10DRAFT_2324716 [Mycena sp. CBHHK59/15]
MSYSYHAPNRSQRIDTSVDYETHPGDTTQDTSFSVSQDGRCGTRWAINVEPKRRKIRPSDLDDTLSNWTPLADDTQEDDPEAGDTGEKRKRYESSDDAMAGWRRLIQRFLDELLRREGLNAEAQCAGCKETFGQGDRRFRCGREGWS